MQSIPVQSIFVQSIPIRPILIPSIPVPSIPVNLFPYNLYQYNLFLTSKPERPSYNLSQIISFFCLKTLQCLPILGLQYSRGSRAVTHRNTPTHCAPVTPVSLFFTQCDRHTPLLGTLHKLLLRMFLLQVLQGSCSHLVSLNHVFKTSHFKCRLSPFTTPSPLYPTLLIFFFLMTYHLQMDY